MTDMDYKRDIFLYIAEHLEGAGAPKDDPKTLYGITQRNYPAFYNSLDEALKQGYDVMRIRPLIVDIYNKIWDKVLAEKLPYPLNFYYFDFAFNSGRYWAVYHLQKLANHMMDGTPLKLDGIWGPKTGAKLAGMFIYTGPASYKYNLMRIRFVVDQEHGPGLVHRILNLIEKIQG